MVAVPAFHSPRSGFERRCWSSSRSAPTQPYSALPRQAMLLLCKSRIRFLPFLLPFLWWGRSGGASVGSGGGFGFGGILGLLIISELSSSSVELLLKNLATARRDRLNGSSSGVLGGERYAVVKVPARLAVHRSVVATRPANLLRTTASTTP